MMIICKASLRFFHPENVGESYVATPNPLPVEVPDWIRKADMFDLSVKDGNIIVPEGGHSFGTTLNPTQLQSLTDDELDELDGNVDDEIDRRRAAAKAAKPALGAVGSTGKSTGTGPVPATGDAGAKAADAGKAANEDKAAASTGGTTGAPAPTAGTTQTSVPASKSGDGNTART